MASSLTDLAIAVGYPQLLHIDGGVTSSLASVYDGDGTATPLKISTTAVQIIDGSYDFDIASHDGTNGLKLGGTLVTATAAEINALSGLSINSTQLNYLDITTLGTAEASKAVTTDANKDITGLRNITGTGTATFANFVGSGDTTIGDAPTDTIAINSTITTDLIFEGSTANDFELTLTPGDPTADRTLTLPDATDQLVGRATSDTLTNKSIDADNNTLSNIVLTNLKSGVLDTDISSVSGSDDTLASAKAIKTYIDAQVTAQDLDFQGDSGGALSIDLDSESLTFAGGTGVATVGSGNTVTFNSVDSEIVHDNLSGFVANEHIDHTSVTLTAGNGLTGGGDISTNRSFAVGEGTGITVNSDTIQTNDSEIVHDNLSGFVANEHIDHSSVTLTAGNGLSGGGDITASRSFALDLNELTTETTIADTDFIAMVDATDNGSGKITFENLEDAIFASVSGDINIAEDGTATIQANSVALATDTTGDFVASITAGTGLTSTGATSGENIAHSLSVDASQTQITAVGALGTGSISSGFGNIDIGSSDLTATGTVSLGASSFNDNNITNVGDIALDSISADGSTINVAIGDNTSDVFTIKQSTNKYFAIDTSDTAENIAIGTGVSGTAISIGHSTSTTTINDDLIVTGDLTVNGATTTLNTTNSVIADTLIELGNGTTGTPANDSGIVIERGDSNNAFLGFDESDDKFIVGTGTFTGASTGSLTITTGTLKANIEGSLDVSSSTLTTSAAQNLAIMQGANSNVDIGAFEMRASTFESDVATGTAPMVVASTTKVANLNADLLDDQTGSYYLDFSNFVVDDNEISGDKINGGTIDSITITALAGAVDLGTNNITNIGSVALTTLESSSTGAGFTVALVDNVDPAITFKQGTTEYMKISTSDGGESIEFHKPVEFGTNVGTINFSSNNMTNVDIDSGTIDGTTIGASSASTGAFTTLTASGDVNFDSNTLFVDASENKVSIGTTSPLTYGGYHPAKFSVDGESFTGSMAVTEYQDGISGGLLAIGHSRGTIASKAKLNQNDIAGRLLFSGYNGTDFRTITGEIRSTVTTATGSIADGVMAGNLEFRTNAGASDDASVAMTIDSSQRVGIGTTSPSDQLTISNSGEASVAIIGSAGVGGGDATLYLVENNTNFGIRMRYDGGDDRLYINADEDTRNLMTIKRDGSGVGIGVTSPSSNIHIDCGAPSSSDKTIGIFQAESSRQLGLGWDDNVSSMAIGTITNHNLNIFTNGITNPRMTVTSDGDIGFNDTSPSTALTSFGSASKGLSIKNAQPTIALTDTDASGHMWIANVGGTSYFQNNVSGSIFRFLTSGGEKLRILNGGGITFNGDTATANALDDYEEGAISTSVSGITASTNSVTGTYTKIGRLVHLEVRVTISGKSGGTGNPFIPLPFNAGGAGIGASIVGAQLSKNTIITGGSPAYLGLYGSTNQVYANDVSGNYIGEGDWGNGVMGFNLVYNT